MNTGCVPTPPCKVREVPPLHHSSASDASTHAVFVSYNPAPNMHDSWGMSPCTLTRVLMMDVDDGYALQVFIIIIISENYENN